MSTQQVDTLTNAAGNGAPNLPFGINFGAVAAAGRYTPTNSGSNTNFTSATFNSSHYSRVNNEVTVFGSVTIAATGSGAVVFNFSVPIASAFVATTDLAGNSQHFNNNDTDGYMQANTSLGSAQMNYVALSSSPILIYFSFMYQVI